MRQELMIKVNGHESDDIIMTFSFRQTRGAIYIWEPLSQTAIFMVVSRTLNLAICDQYSRLASCAVI